MNRCLDQSDGDQLLLADDAFVVKRLRHLGVPLALEPRDLEAWTRALASAPIAEREARGREALTLRRINSRLLLQIMMKDKLVGVISLGSRRDGRSFSEEDKRLLMSVAGQMAFIIENTKLFGRMVEDERLRRELALAAEVQQRLFPSVPPATRALELAGFCQPARGIGGDYYDFLELDNGQIGVAVADVAGKGIAAALLMSMVQASLRSQAMMQDQTLKAETALAYLVSTMNHLLWRSTDAASYATFFYAQFDETQRRLTYVNAGHNPPFLLRVGGVESSVETPATSPYHDHPYDKQQAACALAVQPKVEIAASATMPGDHCASSTGARLLTTGGPVIGVFEDCLYRQETVELEHGDLIVAYTDGVTEALNIEGEEFGEERLQETLAASMNFPADEVRDYVIERVRRWSAGAPQHDDLTFVVVKVK